MNPNWPKPKLYRLKFVGLYENLGYYYRWACKDNSISGYGDTPKEAYLNWAQQRIWYVNCE